MGYARVALAGMAFWDSNPLFVFEIRQPTELDFTKLVLVWEPELISPNFLASRDQWIMIVVDQPRGSSQLFMQYKIQIWGLQFVLQLRPRPAVSLMEPSFYILVLQSLRAMTNTSPYGTKFTDCSTVWNGVTKKTDNSHAQLSANKKYKGHLGMTDHGVFKQHYAVILEHEGYGFWCSEKLCISSVSLW